MCTPALTTKKEKKPQPTKNKTKNLPQNGDAHFQEWITGNQVGQF